MSGHGERTPLKGSKTDHPAAFLAVRNHPGSLLTRPTSALESRQRLGSLVCLVYETFAILKMENGGNKA